MLYIKVIFQNNFDGLGYWVIPRIKARKANRDLVAELSHDLKTPVATIQAGCEVLDAQMLRKKASDDGSGEFFFSKYD